jgi:hypothetical protein
MFRVDCQETREAIDLRVAGSRSRPMGRPAAL